MGELSVIQELDVRHSHWEMTDAGWGKVCDSASGILREAGSVLGHEEDRVPEASIVVTGLCLTSMLISQYVDCFESSISNCKARGRNDTFHLNSKGHIVLSRLTADICMLSFWMVPRRHVKVRGQTQESPKCMSGWF